MFLLSSLSQTYKRIILAGTDLPFTLLICIEQDYILAMVNI